MAHKFTSGFYLREPAWHGLGHVFSEPVRDPAEVVRLAGMGYPVDTWPAYAADPDGAVKAVPGWRAVGRKDNGEVFGFVGDKYHVAQNADIVSAFEPILRDPRCELDAAIVLAGGAVCSLTAKIGDLAEVADGDEVAPYLVLLWGHGGRMAVHLMYTAVRVVCWNTAGCALSAATDETRRKFRHTSGLPLNLRNAVEALDLAHRAFADSLPSFRRMAETELVGDRRLSYFAQVLDTDVSVLEREGRGRAPLLRTLVETDESFPHQFPSDRRTLWGAYNAVTALADHVRGRSLEARVASTWYGDAKALRGRALDKALALLG